MKYTKERFFDMPSSRSLLTREGEVELAKQLATGGPDAEEARNELVQMNQGLVISIARKHGDQGLPLVDLIQEGNLGLLRAIDKYDYRLGYRFSTYAVWWIRQAVTRALADKSRTIRVPVHMVEKLKKVANTRLALVNAKSGEVELQDIANRLGMSVSKLRRTINVAKSPVSLDAPLKGQEDRSFGDLLAATDAIPADEAVASKEISEYAAQMLSSLNKREEKMIRLRFGIGFDRPHTLKEIGDKFGVCRERVRQIESQAFEKIRISWDESTLVNLMET